MGIEPTRPDKLLSTVLKTATDTSTANASEATQCSMVNNEIYGRKCTTDAQVGSGAELVNGLDTWPRAVAVLNGILHPRSTT